MYEKQFEDVKGMYVILDGNKYYVHTFNIFKLFFIHNYHPPLIFLV